MKEGTIVEQGGASAWANWARWRAAERSRANAVAKYRRMKREMMRYRSELLYLREQLAASGGDTCPGGGGGGGGKVVRSTSLQVCLWGG